MHAGDRLDFIQPFDTARDSTDPTDKECREQLAVIEAIMQTMVRDRPENVDSIVVYDGEVGFNVMFEASYRLDMPDGSYLHILIHGQQDEDGVPFWVGVSVIEHLDDGTFNGGYLYDATHKGVRRTRFIKDSNDVEVGDEDQKSHFSLIDYYKDMEAFETFLQSDDIDEMMMAIAVRAEAEENAFFRRLIGDAGFDNLPPYEGELEKLAKLIKDAYSFSIRGL